MRRSLVAAFLAATTLLAACGDDGDEAADTTAAASTTTAAAVDELATTSVPAEVASTESAPATTEPGVPDAAGGASPQAIVSLSPVATEILFAIGAGDQVIAVDDQSNYPPEAESVKTDLSGFEPNIEAIASYEPDLVVVESQNVADALEALDITTWVGSAAGTLDDAYAQIEQLGAATGHIAEAAEVVATMQTDIAAIVEAMPELDTPLTAYHELSPDFYSADSTTFIGQVYSQLGVRNVADQAEGDSGGYPQLSAEAIISANPDLIFLADTKCCGESPETVAARDGWQDITAVANDAVYAMDDDIASRWGPRIVEYYQQVADAVTAAAGVPAGG